jgi:hypothetical protein
LANRPSLRLHPGGPRDWSLVWLRSRSAPESNERLTTSRKKAIPIERHELVESPRTHRRRRCFGVFGAGQYRNSAEHRAKCGMKSARARDWEPATERR